MTCDEFQQLLRKGLGRTILFARDHDVREFRDVILDACLHQYAFDPQVEGTRGWYMNELLECLPDKQFYRERVLRSLCGCSDNWDAVQRFHFAYLLAINGDDEAKRAMYEAYDPGPSMGESIGIDFVHLDGVPGLLFVAKKIGALMLEQPDEVDQGWLINEAFDACGEKEIWDALGASSKDDPQIRAYYLAARWQRERLSSSNYQLRKQEVFSLDYEQLKNVVARTDLFLFKTWGERASTQELIKAADGLIKAETPEDQTAHLLIFERTPFPLNIEALTSLAFVNEGRVGFHAVKALSILEHPAIRGVAFELIGTDSAARGNAIKLLNKNFVMGDHAAVLGWFEQEQNQNVKHWLGMDLQRFWEANPQEESESRMLYSLYENGPCSHCRSHVVRRLIQLNALKPGMRAECEFDANDQVRELVISGAVDIET